MGRLCTPYPEITCVAMQGLVGDLYPISGVEDVDAHLAALEERFRTSKDRFPGLKAIYLHDQNLLLDARVALTKVRRCK